MLAYLMCSVKVEPKVEVKAPSAIKEEKNRIRKEKPPLKSAAEK